MSKDSQETRFELSEPIKIRPGEISRGSSVTSAPRVSDPRFRQARVVTARYRPHLFLFPFPEVTSRRLGTTRARCHHRAARPSIILPVDSSIAGPFYVLIYRLFALVRQRTAETRHRKRPIYDRREHGIGSERRPRHPCKPTSPINKYYHF